MQVFVRLSAVESRTAAARLVLTVLATGALLIAQTDVSRSSAPSDPGPRGGAPGAGGPISGLVGNEPGVFRAGLDAFQQVNSVTGTLTGEGGLGPMFNLDSCGGCHSQPAFGGSAPQVNPQVAVANKAGALNRIPSFITSDGPVREARLIRNPNGTPDGGVAALFTIKGRTDAPGCNLDQPDFATAVKTNNVSFRIPTPLFGSGLIEAIDDSTVVANMKSSSALKAQKGISGHANRSGNDGSMTRFGWKAQNKSLMIFAAEAYNVEQGVTTDLFMQERDSTPGCHFENTPEDHMDVNAGNIQDAIGDVIKFTFFMRMLAPPARGPLNASINNGANLFNTTGCSLCHTATLQTSPNSTPAFSSKPVNLYSDLLVHNMGSGLADGVTQGAAGPGDFRTAPLWGLGQRLFFLHDGRTSNLVEAIKAHSSSGSEANAVITDYNALSTSQKQDILNFLRSL